jgi:hypothetical protein
MQFFFRPSPLSFCQIDQHAIAQILNWWRMNKRRRCYWRIWPICFRSSSNSNSTMHQSWDRLQHGWPIAGLLGQDYACLTGSSIDCLDACLSILSIGPVSLFVSPFLYLGGAAGVVSITGRSCCSAALAEVSKTQRNHVSFVKLGPNRLNSMPPEVRFQAHQASSSEALFQCENVDHWSTWLAPTYPTLLD